VALAPITIKYADPAANRRTILAAINKAAKAGANIVCLPEYCVSGYSYGRDEKKSVTFAEKFDGNPFISKLHKISKERDIDIAIGMLEKRGDKIHNSALYIANGKTVHVHRKIHEGGPVTPGEKVETFKTRFGRAAIIICGDLFDKKVIGQIKEIKPDFVLMPMDRNLHPLALCATYKEKCNYECNAEKKAVCYKKKFRTFKEAWEARHRAEYNAEIKKYGVETFVVNGLSAGGHNLGCGGAMHIGGDGELLAEIPYGKTGVLPVLAKGK
jgi:hypothetical protein